MPLENRPGPKRKVVSQPPLFKCKLLVSGRVSHEFACFVHIPRLTGLDIFIGSPLKGLPQGFIDGIYIHRDVPKKLLQTNGIMYQYSTGAGFLPIKSITTIDELTVYLILQQKMKKTALLSIILIV